MLKRLRLSLKLDLALPIIMSLVVGSIALSSGYLNMDKNNYIFERSQMVEAQLKARGINDQKLLMVMQKTPRHLFVPDNMQEYAYEDRPLPIGYNQTISQPYIVALMTEAANLHPDSKVLEIGTGSGYQAAILAELCHEVYTIELVEALGKLAQKCLKNMGYNNVHVKVGDGYKGWPEQAPFDAIIATAAPEDVPQSLLEQLKDGGRLVIPVGSISQELLRITRSKDGFTKESILPVRFVPMVKES